MEGQAAFLGLPAETWLIVGGLYLVATFLPTAIALILRYKEMKRPNE